jgi:hypothetical protein
MELPAHPEDHETSGPAHEPLPDRTPEPGRRRSSTMIAVVVGTLVVVLLVLHLTGVVGPAGR